MITAWQNPRTGDCNFGNTAQPTDSCVKTVYAIEDFTLVRLAPDEMPYAAGYSTVNKREHLDADSLPRMEYHGKLYDHPIILAQYGLEILDVMHTTGDSSYSKKILQLATKLISISEAVDSSLLFPYQYNYQVHDCESAQMVAPWYSAMAQGQALSFMCRVFTLTNDTTYLTICERIFNSFQKIKGNHEKHWFGCIDQENHLWFEEYPNEMPFHTLNGMIFTLYGLYDYYMLTNNATSKQLLQGGLLTIKSNIQKYRNKNGPSSYCLQHRYVDEYYHRLHIEQLEMLYQMTRDEAFLQAKQDFLSDYPKQE